MAVVSKSVTKFPGTVTQSKNVPDQTQYIYPRGAWGGLYAVKKCDALHTYYNCPQGGANLSEYLYMSNFGFKIPSKAKIKGIQVQVKRKQVNVNGFGSKFEVYDETVQLIKDSTTRIGNNKALTGTRWESTPTVKSYGGKTVTWNVKPTASIVNSKGFGVAVRVRHPTTKHPFLYIDCVKITVYYEGSSAGSSTKPKPKPSLAAKPAHTIKITDPATGNALGFFAEAPDPQPDYAEQNLEEVEIENSYPKFYPTNFKYQKFTFKVTLEGKPQTLRNQLLTIVNKPVKVVSNWGYNYTSWVTYKPGYKNGHPNVMFAEFTVQRIA